MCSLSQVIKHQWNWNSIVAFMVMSSNRLIRKMSGSYLKWENHINNICGKANKTLGFLHHNLNIDSTSIKTGLPIFSQTLEYVSSVWDLHLKTNINKIEMVQWKAARYVNNRQQNTSSVGDMLQLSWCIKSSVSTRWQSVNVTGFHRPWGTPEICTLSYQVPLIMVM